MTLWTREMKIGAWGRYGEKVAADGCVLVAHGRRFEGVRP